MLQNLTLEAIKTSYLAANAAYCTRKGASANLNKKGINPDIYKGMRAWETMSESQFTAVALMLSGAGVNVLTGIEGATNTKKALRIPQFLLLGRIGRLPGIAGQRPHSAARNSSAALRGS
jgi:hypothetical protein